MIFSLLLTLSTWAFSGVPHYKNSFIIDKYFLEQKQATVSVEEGGRLFIQNFLTHQNLFPNIKMPQRVIVKFDFKYSCQHPIKARRLGNITELKFKQIKNSCTITLHHPSLAYNLVINVITQNDPPLITFLKNDQLPLAKVLYTRKSGINAKVAALLGKELTQEEINLKNPQMPLDLTNLPKIDAIYVSTLVYKNDFYGNIISRLLMAHADRGAQVKIIVTNTLLNLSHREKDRALMRRLELYSPNIKVYRYKTNDIDRWHRAFHAKALITLSSTEQNKLIIGGRNIADEFLFTNIPNHSSYPELMQYLSGEDRFAAFEDIEYEYHSNSESVYLACMLNIFWGKFTHCNKLRQKNSNTKSFLSIPYADGNRLEENYVSQIKNAKKIKITSPYFLPSPKITKALTIAIQNGAKVELVTQMLLTNDDFPKLAENVNKVGLEKFFNSIAVFSWQPPKTIIHSKIIILDDSIALVGSPNMDSRSFTQDIEGGLVTSDPEVVGQLLKVFEDYKAQSQRLNKITLPSTLVRFLINLLENYF
ncbi:MAG: phosphatidylserine/phosphatidylglycerophosphate/cardiolipin synthase family protein [Oligoflexia bacterium]|nr:phosphatidylserine/phosphatidylglycerophosphate/cardiolipin synthase family protein [Oligoflexia bacterium]